MSKKPRVPKRQVALHLSKAPTPQVMAHAMHFVTCMSGNAHFPNPYPSMMTIIADLSALASAYDLSLTRARGTAAAMHTERKKLEFNLNALARYVEYIANSDAEDASSIICHAGMTEKKSAFHGVKAFSATPRKALGEVRLDTKATPRTIYTYQMSSNPDKEDSWQTIYTGLSSRFIQAGLKAEKHYSFRVKKLLKGHEEEWSHALDVFVA